jgi:hypothetical protein
MTETSKVILPGNQRFHLFIEQKVIFGDKTKIKYNLISDYTWPFFLARPRRFSKTLLLNIISNIFSGNKTLFEKLDIAKCGCGWEPFPIIKFSFNEYPADPQNLEAVLTRALNIIAQEFNLELSKLTDLTNISTTLKSLSRLHLANFENYRIRHEGK